MNPKIVHLTSVHRAHDVRIFEKQCKSLATVGFQVTLIAPHNQREFANGVTICPIETPVNRRQRLTQTVPQILKASLRENAAVYHFHDPELIPVGWMLKRRGNRVIYDVHEDVPKQIESKAWIPRVLRGIVGRTTGEVEAWAARWLDGIVAATPVIASRFPPEKTVTVNNYPLLDSLPNPCGQPRMQAEKKFITYVGGISQERGIFELMLASSSLAKRYNLQLVLAGKFMPSNLEHELRAHDAWSHVDFRGWCSRKEIMGLLHDSSVGVVPLHPLQRFIDSQPVKMYEYMAAGIPVVASDFPRWREVIQTSGCGLLAKPSDPNSLADSIEWLLNRPQEAHEMGQRGRVAIDKRYNWKNEETVLIELYDRIIREDYHHHRSKASVREGSPREQKPGCAA